MADTEPLDGENLSTDDLLKFLRTFSLAQGKRYKDRSIRLGPNPTLHEGDLVSPGEEVTQRNKLPVIKHSSPFGNGSSSLVA